MSGCKCNSSLMEYSGNTDWSFIFLYLIFLDFILYFYEKDVETDRKHGPLEASKMSKRYSDFFPPLVGEPKHCVATGVGANLVAPIPLKRLLRWFANFSNFLRAFDDARVKIMYFWGIVLFQVLFFFIHQTV